MEWTRGQIIGRGASASVSLATTTTGKPFAVKSVELSSSTLLQKEYNLISQLCSPYVVKCLGSDTTLENNKSLYNLFLEYVPGGTLSDLIKEQGGSLKENAIQHYTHQILQGLNYLHLSGLVHCDIKGQNLLISNDGLKLADFGCAKFVDNSTSGLAGTPAYMSPEVARGEEQSFPADVWAMGCVIIEMATGSNPWPEMKDPASALYRIGYSGEVPEFPIWFSGNAKDFVTKCLIRDPKERWTVTELLQHPFMNFEGESCCEEVFIRKSPTSVMDQAFWDDLEVSDSSQSSTEIPSTSDSPVGRIRDLIGGVDFSSNLDFPDWTEEEDWVTVRGNEIEELSVAVEQIDYTVEDYEELISEEEIQTLIGVEDSLFSYFSDEISSSSNEQSIVLLSDSSAAEDVSVLKVVNFENILMELSLHSDLLLYVSFSFFFSLMRLIISPLLKFGVFPPFRKEVITAASQLI